MPVGRGDPLCGTMRISISGTRRLGSTRFVGEVDVEIDAQVSRARDVFGECPERGLSGTHVAVFTNASATVALVMFGAG